MLSPPPSGRSRRVPRVPLARRSVLDDCSRAPPASLVWSRPADAPLGAVCWCLVEDFTPTFIRAVGPSFIVLGCFVWLWFQNECRSISSSSSVWEGLGRVSGDSYERPVASAGEASWSRTLRSEVFHYRSSLLTCDRSVQTFCFSLGRFWWLTRFPRQGCHVRWAVRSVPSGPLHAPEGQSAATSPCPHTHPLSVSLRVCHWVNLLS